MLGPDSVAVIPFDADAVSVAWVRLSEGSLPRLTSTGSVAFPSGAGHDGVADGGRRLLGAAVAARRTGAAVDVLREVGDVERSPAARVVPARARLVGAVTHAVLGLR